MKYLKFVDFCFYFRLPKKLLACDEYSDTWFPRFADDYNRELYKLLVIHKIRGTAPKSISY